MMAARGSVTVGWSLDLQLDITAVAHVNRLLLHYRRQAIQ